MTITAPGPGTSSALVAVVALLGLGRGLILAVQMLRAITARVRDRLQRRASRRAPTQPRLTVSSVHAGSAAPSH